MTTVEITGGVQSVNAIAGAMSINGLLEVRKLPFFGKALDYETKEDAVSAMRAAFDELTEGEEESAMDSISSDGERLYYDAAKAAIYNPVV